MEKPINKVNSYIAERKEQYEPVIAIGAAKMGMHFVAYAPKAFSDKKLIDEMERS